MVYIVHSPTKEFPSRTQRPLLPVHSERIDVDEDTIRRFCLGINTDDLLSIGQSTVDAFRERIRTPSPPPTPIGVTPTEMELEEAAHEVTLDILPPLSTEASFEEVEEKGHNNSLDEASSLFRGLVFACGMVSVAVGAILVHLNHEHPIPIWLIATCSSMVATLCWALLAKDSLAGLHGRALWYEDILGYHDANVAERATWWFKWLVVISVVLSSGAVAEYGVIKWGQEDRPWLEDLALLGGILSLYSRMLSFIGYSVLTAIVWLNDRQGHHRTPVLGTA